MDIKNRFTGEVIFSFDGVSLSDADLRDAVISGAVLSNCSGNRSEIKSVFISDIYPITYTYDQLQIGCERHKISQWWEFDNKTILRIDGKAALKFWDKNKELIKMIIDSNPAKATGKEG